MIVYLPSPLRIGMVPCCFIKKNVKALDDAFHIYKVISVTQFSLKSIANKLLSQQVWADIELNFMKPKTREAQRHLQEGLFDFLTFLQT